MLESRLNEALKPRKAGGCFSSLVVVLFLLVMTVLMTVVPVMFLLFIMPGGSFLCKINPPLSFYIVRTASVDLDMYSWRCRRVAIDVDIHIGRTWQPRRGGEPGPCIIEA